MSNLRRQLLLSNPSTTVQKLVDKGILSVTSDVDTNTKLYKFTKSYRKSFNKIKDFKQVFMGNTSPVLSGLSINYSDNFLSKGQIDELIKIINTTDNNQNLRNYFYLNLGNSDFINTDIVFNLNTSDDYDSYVKDYQFFPDALAGSTINSVTLDIKKGNFSSMQNFLRNCNCKRFNINLNGGVCIPTDVSGLCEFNKILTSFPNNINWANCGNIGYAWEWCSALTEIPSYYTVTDEVSRLNTTENIIGGNSGNLGFVEQAFNICKSLTKIGPVLNFIQILPNDTTYKQPLNLFNDSLNISNIRLKNLSNGDWSFIRKDYRGLPKMDIESIKYTIQNLAKQSDSAFLPLEVNEISTPTYGWSTLVSTSTKSLMYRQANNNGKFLNITGDYKVIIPEGLTLKLVWWISSKENNYNKAYNEFTYIIGDNAEHTLTNTLTDYQWCTIEIQNTDGSDLSRDNLHQVLLYNNLEFYIGDNTTNYIIPTLHNIYFDTTYKAQIEARDVITPEIIKEANNKGWNIYIGDTLLTPYDIDVVSYGISWETDNNVCTRIGNLELHKTLPIQSKLRGCVAKGTDIQYYLKADDWNYKEDGSASRLDGYDGNVDVDTGDIFYYKSFIKGTTREMRISEIQVDETWHRFDRKLIFAYAPVLLRKIPSDMGYLSTLSVNSWISVVNTSTYCRGGNNDSSYDKYLGVNDYRTGLGKPTTNISRGTAREYAQKNNQILLDYTTYKIIFYWLPIIEYNTFNLDQPFNSELTSEGYHQGGLAPSFAYNSTNWGTYFNYHQLPLIGSTNDFGNNSGCKTITIPVIEDEEGNALTTATNVYTFRYRGLENIKNHLWNNLDGIIIQNDLENVDESGNALYKNVYVSTDPTQFSDSINGSYVLVGKEINTEGYIKEIALNDSGDIFPESIGTPNKGDYHYVGTKTDTSLRTARLGGDSNNGAPAGVGCFYSDIGVGNTHRHIGFRVFQNFN